MKYISILLKISYILKMIQHPHFHSHFVSNIVLLHERFSYIIYNPCEISYVLNPEFQKYPWWYLSHGLHVGFMTKVREKKRSSSKCFEIHIHFHKCERVQRRRIPITHKKESLWELEFWSVSNLWNKSAYNKPCSNWVLFIPLKDLEGLTLKMGSWIFHFKI